MKKIILTSLFLLAPTVLLAANDAQDVGDNIISTFRYIVNIVGPIVIILVIGFQGGFSYLTKGKEQRSEEDGKELRQLALRVIVGGALIIGSVNIGPELWDLLGGN
ncbi:hypothetical protein [Bacteroides acidifaciens]|uniref:hypothetical protein n=1 Tax=Bacteroides acidifaciens TaxID=85831 RepID=UPI0025948C69|nr:hypothetical protein [Bacteroides acidifaciens]